jgi:hypothetical protein
MKKVQPHYLAEIDTGKQRKTNPVIMRIILNDQFTRIDFGYCAPWIYIRGGWIRIAGHTYIQLQGSLKKYELIEAKNIPLAPEVFEFESKEDWRVFTLYFKPIPIKSCNINIIEEENPTKNDFNFYGVSVNVDLKRVVEYG